jgi:hypothetical protein
MRTVVAPTNDATLVETPARSRCSRYSPSVVHGDVELDVALLGQQLRFIAVVQRPHRPALAEDLERHALPDAALRAAVDEQRLGRPSSAC